MIRAVNWVKALPGGETRPQVFVCSDGNEWVLKFVDNPHQGKQAVVADWLGTALAVLIGVPVLACELVEVDEDAIWTMPDHWQVEVRARPGIAFGSRFLETAIAVTGLTDIRSRASDADLARIVVLDTWLDVLDRKKPGRASWNLLANSAPPGRLVVIDFGMGFGEVLGPPILGMGTPQMMPRIPDGFQPFLHREEIQKVLVMIWNISRTDIRTLIQSLPQVWDIDAVKRQRIEDYLLRRRELLAGCLEDVL